jgi:ribulose-phosphate 3-epimerase
MSVFPGFGGQKFIGGVCAKFAELRDMGFEGRLEIDGGINVETAAEAARAGADLLVAGNSVYGAKDRTKAVRDILASAASAAVASGG